MLFRSPISEEPLTALAFKIATDPYVGRLCYFRVYSGEMVAGSYVLNTRSDKKERISRLFQMHSNKQNPMEKIGCGDIGAGVGFKDIRTVILSVMKIIQSLSSRSSFLIRLSVWLLSLRHRRILIGWA